MFKLRRMGIDTESEHVVFIHENAVKAGLLGFKPMDRVLIEGREPRMGSTRGISGTLHFCEDALLDEREIGLSNVAFADLGLSEGDEVSAQLAVSPQSVDHVRRRLAGGRLGRAEFDAIARDIAVRRYSKAELAMFILACGLQRLDTDEIVDFTRAMIDCGSSLRFDRAPVADKHCIGGVPGNRTTMVVVPILVACGLTVPKTSSKAITSAAGTADTMSTLASVNLTSAELRRVVEQTGGCITWGGALDLAPADDVLITVERPMQIDTEAQMVASILAKKKTAGATHALIDIPIGRTTKVRSRDDAARLAALFHRVASVIELDVDAVTTNASGPIGRGIGPRLEALDVLSVLSRAPEAPFDLREKSLFLAGRILEGTNESAVAEGYSTAREALDSGRALKSFEAIVEAQGARALPRQAPFRRAIESRHDGRIRDIDCRSMNRVARLAGSPAHLAAGLQSLCKVGQVVRRGEPLIEIHAESESQLQLASTYAASELSTIFSFGY